MNARYDFFNILYHVIEPRGGHFSLYWLFNRDPYK